MRQVANRRAGDERTGRGDLHHRIEGLRREMSPSGAVCYSSSSIRRSASLTYEFALGVDLLAVVLSAVRWRPNEWSPEWQGHLPPGGNRD
jgi:hypothetical protein